MAYATVIDFIVVTVLLILWPMHKIAGLTKQWARTMLHLVFHFRKHWTCRNFVTKRWACTKIYWKLINFHSFLMFENFFRCQERLLIWSTVDYCYIDRVCSSECVFLWNALSKCWCETFAVNVTIIKHFACVASGEFIMTIINDTHIWPSHASKSHIKWKL